MFPLLGSTLISPSYHTLFLLLCLRITVYADELTRRVDGNQAFFTRPDIQIPGWKTTVHAQDGLSPGYWFLSPYEHDNQTLTGPGRWTAPMIFDQNGDLVWSGAALTEGFNTFDFRVSNVLGEEMLTFLNPLNRSFVILDNHYNIFKEVQISPTNSSEIDNMRELNFVNDGRRALVFFDAIRNATKPISEEIGFNGTCLLHDSTFREADTKEDWRFVYRWAAHKRIDLSESTKTEGTVDQRCNETVGGWDWVQTNSVDKFNKDGRYLLSARYTNTIYKLFRSGDVQWRLGGNRSDFEADFSFSNQNHARIQSYNDTHTIISFVDNGDPTRGAEGSSRGLIASLQTDTEPKTATLLAQYAHPNGRGAYTTDGGSMQVLPDGNVFSGWVDQLKISEHSADGTLLMEAHAEQDFLKSYRSYKFPFVGQPAQPPDVYAEARGEDGVSTTVYVSWNGATEVEGWNVYKTERNGKPETKKPIAYFQRSGFETKIEIDGYAAYIVVEAIDKDGNPLGRSNVFQTVALSPLPGEVVEEEQQKADTKNAQPGDGKSWKDTAKETSTSQRGIASLFGILAVIAIIFMVVRIRRRRHPVRATKHNRKPSDHEMLGRYANVPVADYDNEDEHAFGEG